MKRIFACWGLLLLLCAGAEAGTPPPIHFTVSARPSTVHPGEIVTITVQAQVDAGWHVYSVVPTPQGPSPTNITSLSIGTPAADATEDAPVRKLDPNFGAVVGFHEHAAVFTRAFRVSALAPPSAGAANVAVHYQTCNASICLPPTDVVLPVPLTVEAGPIRAAYADAPKAPAVPASPAPNGSGGLGLFLLAAVGAGLLAIATPCVFPLIPITLTNFVKQSGGDRAKLVRLSSGYALGIVALYVALGGIVAATMGATGTNRIAANPWVNLVEFVLFVVFALSFFEAIQLRLPGNLGALQQNARKHGGTAGLALLGVTFVLGSFTCTAPFIGSLLVAASGGTYGRPLLGMFVFALAFVSPFFVFALFPQWIGRIPKGGVWLARFKATLGFLELAAALKFLSNADQVWNWRVLTQPVLLAAWAMIFLCAALYLFGLLRFGLVAETEPANAPIPLSRRLTASVFALATLYCFWGLAGRPISPYVGAFLPASGYGGVAMAAENSGLPWLSDYKTALAQAKAEGKPLLIDFTGVTCTNCRLNEKNIFPRAAVQSALASYVRVQLYTDRGARDLPNQALQQAKFGDVALPLYGVIDPQTETVRGKTEGVQTPSGFARFLAQNSAPVAKSGGLQQSADVPAPMWAAYSPAAVAQAGQAGRPTLVDFTAKWCVNCKEIEHDVFQNPAVAPELASRFVTLRADLTQWGSAPSVALQKQYGFEALPTIIFLDKAGREIKPLRITGRLSVADFQKRLQAAQAPG